MLDWQALQLSILLSALTATLLLVLGLPLAYWLAFSPRRWKVLVEAVVALPLVLPPTVLGFYVLVAISPTAPLGRFYAQLFDRSLPFSFAGLLLASLLYSLPFAVQPFLTSFLAVDRRLIEASWTLGVSTAGTFARVLLPLAAPGILSGFVLSFAHTLGEFGVVLMVGGNLPGQTRTISIAIYDDVQAMNYQRAAVTSAVLLAISFIVLVITYGARRRTGAAWTVR